MSLLDALAVSPVFFICATFVAGLAVGSFLNVVVYRVPVMMEREWRAQCAQYATQAPATAGTATVTAAAAAQPPATDPVDGLPARFNLMVPRSACPKCGAGITALQNIPVISWLLLRGRCAGCGTRISARYPLVELLTGLLSAGVAWRFGFGWEAAAALLLTWFLIALTFIDADTQLLPDSLTLPLVWLGLLVNLALFPGPGMVASGLSLPVSLEDGVIGAVAGYLSLWSVFHLFRLLTGKEGMGYGDFKLFAALGAWLGWRMLLPTILVAAAVGAVTGIAILVIRGRDRGTPLAFGPYLAAAGWVMLLCGPSLVEGYLGLYGIR